MLSWEGGLSSRDFKVKIRATLVSGGRGLFEKNLFATNSKTLTGGIYSLVYELKDHHCF